MTTELAKTYDPKSVEETIYLMWTERGAFGAEPDGRGSSYCIVIPPPNVTDVLHLGHALNNTLQDVLIRWKRMEGFNTLWMPGTDHAGIATQTVVEKRILAEEGKRRTDFPRDEFVRRVQAWKDEYEERILGQLKQIGCSCDWRRTRFTMDEVCARAVREMFFRLFADGLIYRGKRLVNWDPATQTVLADDEVEHEQVHGHFYYMRYPLAEPVEIVGETVEHVTVATTRPETMLGDTAVAMNPADPRAAGLLGKMVRLPLVGREIPIIADEHVVLPNPDSDDEQAKFSTGFLKVTPAHDPNDWEIGRRHELPVVNVLAPDGTISDRHGWPDAAGTEAEQFLGMDRFEAREAIVEWFRTENLLADVREYVHQVGHSYRSHVPIEPYLSDQWYIAIKEPIDRLAEAFGTGNIEGTDVPVNSLAGLALKPLLDKRLRFTPDRYAKTYQTWLENLRDWPISRQLWWGHRIPVWRKEGKHEPPAGIEAVGVRHAETDTGKVTFVCLGPDNEELEQQLADSGWQQDEDVLDTWFSSALWPFSTLGWPEETPELETFYPGDVLVTAREIITLWVSRMVMMGQYALGDIPFRDVFIHAMIQDGQGRKMSKSLGNGIDPLTISDSHGADAMRFTLVSMTTQTQDVRMPVEEMTLPDGRKANTSPKFDQGRNFCNKLWNAARFTMMNLSGAPPLSDIEPHANISDAWILSRFHSAARDATRALTGYRYNELGETLYHFMWDDFCDWYLEIAKARINSGENAPRAVLAYVLDGLLRLLHPVVPFITEAVWQRLNEVAPRRGPDNATAEPMLVRAQWPRADAACIDPALEQRFETLRDLIREVRNVRTQHNIPRSQSTDVVVEAQGREAEFIADNGALIRSQASVGELSIQKPGYRPPADAAAATVGTVKLYVLGAVDREAELSRLSKEADKLRKAIESAEKKLSNENFVQKAPAEVVRQQRDRLAEQKAQLAAVEDAMEKLR